MPIKDTCLTRSDSLTERGVSVGQGGMCGLFQGHPGHERREGGLHTDRQDRGLCSGQLDILLFDDERSNVVPGLLVVLGVGTITEGKLQETKF